MPKKRKPKKSRNPRTTLRGGLTVGDGPEPSKTFLSPPKVVLDFGSCEYFRTLSAEYFRECRGYTFGLLSPLPGSLVAEALTEMGWSKERYDAAVRAFNDGSKYALDPVFKRVAKRIESNPALQKHTQPTRGSIHIVNTGTTPGPVRSGPR